MSLIHSELSRLEVALRSTPPGERFDEILCSAASALLGHDPMTYASPIDFISAYRLSKLSFFV
jgi:hypothetical protein